MNSKENMNKNDGTQSMTDIGQRQALKNQLDQWKRDKEELKTKEKDDKKRKEEMAKHMLRSKIDEDRKWKKE